MSEQETDDLKNQHEIQRRYSQQKKSDEKHKWYILTAFLLLLLILSLIISGKGQTNQLISAKQYITSLLEKRTAPSPYNLTTEGPSILIKELPFCIIYKNDQSLKEFLKLENYTNVQTIHVTKDDTRSLNLGVLNQNIFSFCSFNSIILFLSKIPPKGILSQLNHIYQTQNVWATYYLQSDSVQITSAFHKMLTLVQYNNLTGQIVNNSIIPHSELTLDILEMANSHLKKHQFEESVSFIKSNEVGYLSTKRPRYETMQSMRQFSKMNREEDNRFYEQMMRKQGGTAKEIEFKGYSQEKILLALEFKELINLPLNHSLGEKERILREKKYRLEEYSSEKPFCVVVPSHGNKPDNRFERAFLSIFQQEYKNYHIVFIDDYSDDDTLIATMDLAKKLHFPTHRITYIQNLINSFSTYSMLNAVHNFCTNDEIFVRVDGDDEIIGRQAFRLLNYGFQHKQNWLVWTTYVSTIYGFGMSQFIKNRRDFVNNDNTRRGQHLVGHLTSFYIPLYKRIQLQDHQCPSGKWFTFASDDFIQFPLLEMAAPSHAQYIPEICYYYNIRYGNNQDSTPDRREYRAKMSKQFRDNRTLYEPLQQLDLQYQNDQILQVLKRDEGIRYKKISSPDDIIQFIKSDESEDRFPCKEFAPSLT